jgi:hypothetical protein
MKKLAPGCYELDDGTLHICAPEFLKAHGWPDSPENRQRIVDVAKQFYASQGIEVTEEAE